MDVYAEDQIGVANVIHILEQICKSLIGRGLRLDEQFFLIEILTVERERIVDVLHGVEVIFALYILDDRDAILVKVIGQAFNAILQEIDGLIFAKPIHVHYCGFRML